MSTVDSSRIEEREIQKRGVRFFRWCIGWVTNYSYHFTIEENPFFPYESYEKTERFVPFTKIPE